MTPFTRTVRQYPALVLVPFVLVVLLCWELSSRYDLLDPYRFSSPGLVADTFVHDIGIPATTHSDTNRSRSGIYHISQTLLRFMSGFGLAIVVGVGIGFLLGKVQTVQALGRPVVNALRGLPSAAIWPICALIPKHKFLSQVLVIWFGAMWPILMNTMDAMLKLPQEIHDSLSFMKIEWYRRWWVLMLWAAPMIFTGLEIGCSVAFLLTITVEVFWPANGGLGWYLFTYGMDGNDVHCLFAAVLVIAVLGWSINTLMHKVGDWMIFWDRDIPEVLEQKPARRAKRLLDQIQHPGLKAILQNDEVTETIEREFGAKVDSRNLRVRYQGEPYIFPRELWRLGVTSGGLFMQWKRRLFNLALWNSVGETRPNRLIQRDITISAPRDGTAKEKTILFARSWINLAALGQTSVEQLQENQLTIGMILRSIESDCSYKNLWYRNHISKKLGPAFDTRGAVHVIQRARVICVSGTPAILIQEFVPVL